MENRGISSIIVIIVVIAIITLTVAGYSLLTQKEGLPVYPGAIPSEIPESELYSAFAAYGISVSAYTTGASSNEVLDWYRSEMSNRGWMNVLDNTFDNSHLLLYQKGNEGAGVIENSGTLILTYGSLEQFQTIAAEWYHELQAPLYPVLSASPAANNGAIRIEVQEGSFSEGEWEYSVSQTVGSHNWTIGTEELSSPHVVLGTYTQGTYYVSLRHIPTGHIYFADAEVIIS